MKTMMRIHLNDQIFDPAGNLVGIIEVTTPNVQLKEGYVEVVFNGSKYFIPYQSVHYINTYLAD